MKNFIFVLDILLQLVAVISLSFSFHFCLLLEKLYLFEEMGVLHRELCISLWCYILIYAVSSFSLFLFSAFYNFGNIKVFLC